MTNPPMAFLSYVRLDDEFEEGRISQLRSRLSGEVRMQTGMPFEIFQDRRDIAWGQQWQRRIAESIDAVTFFIPIITPAFFNSGPCRDELERFLAHEERLGRTDLVLPLYYVECPLLGDAKRRASDPLAEAIAARQHADWRELRFESFTALSVGKALAEMARHISRALDPGDAVTSGPGGLSRSGVKATPEQAPARSRPRERSSPAGATPKVRAGGPSPKTEPPTLVVDAMHRGDHATIGAALAAAPPGARILVRAGLYREGLVMDKPIEIIGEGEPGDVVVEATGKDAVLFQAGMGRIANLTLRQLGGGDWYGVDIAQGRLELEDCDISSKGLACVAIHGGADPRLRRNAIHAGSGAGVAIYQNGLGTLEDNEIFANALAGVSIDSGGNPTLRRNRIRDGKQSGVFVYDNGQGTLDDNEIFGNTFVGVEITEGGNPTLRRNRIRDGKQSGVFVYKDGQGTLEDNEIFANALAGVEIIDGGNPTLRINRIRDGKGNGVQVHKGGLGTLEDNDIVGNLVNGVTTASGGDPTIRNNRINDNKRHGVAVQEDGAGRFEGNDLRNNRLGAWSFAPGAESEVIRSGNTEA